MEVVELPKYSNSMQISMSIILMISILLFHLKLVDLFVGNVRLSIMLSDNTSFEKSSTTFRYCLKKKN